MSAGLSVTGDLWNDLDKQTRLYLLSNVFKSRTTVGKHIDKKYFELPVHFRQFLHELIYTTMKRYLEAKKNETFQIQRY